MSLSPATVFALAERCAPAVAAQTLSAVALAESDLDPFAIHVNRGPELARRPVSRAEALTAARTLQAAGANFDLGLLQINLTNLRRLGLSLADAFDPCRNLAAGAALLQANYSAARAAGPAPQTALRTALSRYNTGDDRRGFRNGYVTRVVQAAVRLDGAPVDPPRPGPASPSLVWDAFGELGGAGFVLSPSSSILGSRP